MLPGRSEKTEKRKEQRNRMSVQWRPVGCWICHQDAQTSPPDKDAAGRARPCYNPAAPEPETPFGRVHRAVVAAFGNEIR